MYKVKTLVECKPRIFTPLININEATEFVYFPNIFSPGRASVFR